MSNRYPEALNHVSDPITAADINKIITAHNELLDFTYHLKKYNDHVVGFLNTILPRMGAPAPLMFYQYMENMDARMQDVEGEFKKQIAASRSGLIIPGGN